jgi:hypothetical protein
MRPAVDTAPSVRGAAAPAQISPARHHTRAARHCLRGARPSTPAPPGHPPTGWLPRRAATASPAARLRARAAPPRAHPRTLPTRCFAPLICFAPNSRQPPGFAWGAPPRPRPRSCARAARGLAPPAPQQSKVHSTPWPRRTRGAPPAPALSPAPLRRPPRTFARSTPGASPSTIALGRPGPHCYLRHLPRTASRAAAERRGLTTGPRPRKGSNWPGSRWPPRARVRSPTSARRPAA